MHNISHEVKGGKLVITCDVSAIALKSAPASASGKTSLVASTGGAVQLPQIDGKSVTFALNVMVKP